MLIDETKIKFIKSYLNDFEIEILDTSISILDNDSRLAFNFFALGIREIITLFLNEKSDIEDIKKCSWYKTFEYNIGATDEVTTKQKLAYIFCGGMSVDDIEKNSTLNIKDKIRFLSQSYRKLNKYIHMNETIDKIKIIAAVENVLEIISEFLDELTKFRNRLNQEYESKIYDIVDEKITIDTLSELYEIAPHYYDPMIDSHEIVNLKLTSDKLILYVKGTISSKIQYGSDGDYRRGDGSREEVNFPFDAILEIELSLVFDENIDSSEIELIKFEVDNDSFFE